MQNGFKVNAYTKQPFVFVVTDKKTGTDDKTGTINEKLTVAGYAKRKPDEVREVAVVGYPIKATKNEEKIVVREILNVPAPAKEVSVVGYRSKGGSRLNEVEVVGYASKPIEDKVPVIAVADLRNTNPHNLLRIKNDVAIIGYTFTIDDNNGKVLESVNKGAVFTPATVSIIQNAKKGSLLLVERIIGVKNGKAVKFPAVIYKVI